MFGGACALGSDHVLLRRSQIERRSQGSPAVDRLLIEELHHGGEGVHRPFTKDQAVTLDTYRTRETPQAKIAAESWTPPTAHVLTLTSCCRS